MEGSAGRFAVGGFPGDAEALLLEVLLLVCVGVVAWLDWCGMGSVLSSMGLSLSIVVAASRGLGLTWLPAKDGAGSAFLDGTTFLKNMSRMLCRRSNSGMSLAEVGRRSLADHSCSLLPSLNMPSGFMTSSMLTLAPSTLTVSLIVAYTGQ